MLNYVALKTIVRKEVIRFMRIWPQTLLPPIITQGLYFAIFGKFIGSQIGQVHGVSYMAFIIPGLVMMAVINNSYANVVSSFFGSKFQRNVEEVMVSPTSNWVIMAGYSIGGILRGLLVGLLVFIISTLFEHPVIFNFGIILLFILLTSLVCSLGGLLNGILATKFDDVSIFPTFILTPMTYLGGVFYSIHSLPEAWQKISMYNPILYMVNGFRYGFYGFTDVSLALSIFLLCLLNVVLAVLTLVMLKKGIGLKS
ncbi:MAG: ABC transporter permease [Omnitrophica WOR_2 bacterium GWA2_47_8]|nr:MAG: ABC transporter permease [Omnitrophica WOR_2 bacterium GWA2_47_8]